MDKNDAILFLTEYGWVIVIVFLLAIMFYLGVG